MKKKLYFALVLFMLTIVASCGVNSNLMLKQDKDAEVNSPDIPLQPREDYKIAVNDKITFRLYAFDGADIIDADENSVNQNQTPIEYTVRRDGNVELPQIGKVQVAGLTIEACEDTLLSRYSEQFKDRFVKVTVTNQRVIVFPGSGAEAKVIPLKNSNTTLMEAIALAGGIADRGKASTVKLMRMENGERKVYIMDLSVIEGLKYTDLVVQANDYIYVEPTSELGKEVAEKVVPVASLITSLVLLFTIISSL